MTIDYKITGDTENPPTYPLDETTIPTTTDVTIADNIATATDDDASLETWDYVAAGNVSKITPSFEMQPTPMVIDPSSTEGSIKINYPDSNTLQVGSKVLVTENGVTTEEAIAAGSQSTINNFDAGWGQLSYFSCNNILFALGTSNRKLAYSVDSGVSWIFSATIGGTGTVYSIVGMAYFDGKYYLGLGYDNNQGTINLWASDDLINWASAHSQTFTNAGSCGVATEGTILSIVYGVNGHSQTTLTIYYFSSTDGSTFTSRGSYTSTGACPLNYTYSNGKFLLAAAGAISYSNDGITYSNNTAQSAVGNIDAVILGIDYTGSLYLISSSSVTSASSRGIFSSSNFSSFTQRQSLSGFQQVPSRIVNNGSIYVVFERNTVNYYTSTNGATWTSLTISSQSFGSHNSLTSIDDNFICSAQNIQYSLFSSGSTAWNAVNMYSFYYYQFTITSPSLQVPDAIYLGGQSLSYSVQSTATPNYQPATVTYDDDNGTITVTGAEYDVSGTHVMLKVNELNNGDIVSLVGASLDVYIPPPAPSPTPSGIPAQIKGNRTPANFIETHYVVGKLFISKEDS